MIFEGAGGPRDDYLEKLKAAAIERRSSKLDLWS
jgi:hypothetical protein